MELKKTPQLPGDTTNVHLLAYVNKYFTLCFINVFYLLTQLLSSVLEWICFLSFCVKKSRVNHKVLLTRMTNSQRPQIADC